MNDEIKVVFTATDGMSVVAEKIAQAFAKINKSSTLTAQQGLQQVNNAIGEKLNRSLRLSTDRTNQFLAALDKMPKKVQETGAAMVNVANGNARLATSFRELSKAPVQVQRALEGVMTQSERSRLGVYRLTRELQNLAATGNVSTRALETRFNQLMSISGLSVERQRALWNDYFSTLPAQQRRAAEQQAAEQARAAKQSEKAMRQEANFLHQVQKQEERDRQQALRQEATAYRTRIQQARQFQQELAQTERNRHAGFSSAINFGRIGLQSALLGSQLASGIASGPGGLLGAVGNAAFLARPLMMAGPKGVAVAAVVVGLTAALTSLTKGLEAASKAAHNATQNLLQMQAVASLRGLPSSVPEQQKGLGEQLSRKYGFKLPSVQSANLNLVEAGLFGPDALNTAALISKAENKPIEEVSKDLADLIQSGQTESFTQKYRLTSARVIGLRKPSLSAAYGSSKDFFQDVQQKLTPDVAKFVAEQPGDRIGASFEHIQETIGSPVWQAFLRVLQPIAELFDRMADEFDRIFKDQKFVDEMAKAFENIGEAMRDVAPLMFDFAKTFAHFIAEAVKGSIHTIPILIRGFAYLATFLNVSMKVALIFIEIFKKMYSVVEPLTVVFRVLWEIWKLIASAIILFLNTLYDLLNGTKSLNDVFKALETILKAIASNIGGFNAAIKGIGDFLRAAADFARGLLDQLLGLLDALSKLVGPWNIAITMPEIKLPTLPDLHINIVLPDLWELLLKPFINIEGRIQDIWGRMWVWIREKADEGVSFVSEKWRLFLAVVMNTKEEIVASWNTVTETILSLPTRIQAAWQGVEEAVDDGIKNLRQAIRNFIHEIENNLTNAPVIGGVLQIYQKIGSSIPQLPGPGEKPPTVPGQGQGVVSGEVASGFPLGISFSSGNPNFPNPFDRKNKRDKDFNADISSLSYSTAPTQVVGPSGYDVPPGANGGTTVNVYIQGGDFSDSAAIQQRAREVGDQIGWNLRGRGGIQIP